MAKRSTICGIDLGTTNSLVAYVNPAGKPLSIANFTGEILTPSMVYLEGNSYVVGEQARRAAQDAPERFAECFKRAMGEDWFPEPVDGRKFRPEVLSALILKRLQTEASRHLGEARSAVITVPAYFDECRRRATKNAGSIAGWDVIDLINEPTAAAIAWAHRFGQTAAPNGKPERLLVYDLGGGTFDTTILEIAHGREYRTLATEGEVRLGGQDWDEWLQRYLAEQFNTKTGADPLATARGAFDFLQIARSTKHHLSQRKNVTVPAMFQGKRAILEIGQETFEKSTAHLLRRSKDTTQIVLDEARLKWTDIDAVLLIGGSTRMPMVERMLHTLTGKPPRRDVSADEAVAHGAAVYAHLLGQPNSPKVINVNSHSYRLACTRQGKSFAHPMIPKNSPLPKQSGIKIPTTRAGMETIFVNIFEGESEDVKMCYQIGRVRIDGLPKDANKRWLVALVLKCLEDGKIAVSAAVRDPDNPTTTLCEASATLESEHGMKADDLHEAQRFVNSLEVG